MTLLKTKILSVVALVLVVAALTEAGSSPRCTPATCPDSPVFATFDNLYCTGNMKLQTVELEWNKCSGSSTQSGHSVFTDTYFEQAVFAGPNCGDGDEFPSYSAERAYFGSCVHNSEDAHFASMMKGKLLSQFNLEGSQSYMYLRNANSSFTSPQYPFHVPGAPTDDSTLSDCDSIPECISKGSVFGGPSEKECTVKGQYLALNASTLVCYQTPTGYQYYNCANVHTVELRLSQNTDCSFPFYSTIVGGVCSKYSDMTFYCTDGPYVNAGHTAQNFGGRHV